MKLSVAGSCLDFFGHCYIKQHGETDPAPGAVRANSEVLYDREAPALKARFLQLTLNFKVNSPKILRVTYFSVFYRENNLSV